MLVFILPTHKGLSQSPGSLSWEQVFNWDLLHDGLLLNQLSYLS